MGLRWHKLQGQSASWFAGLGGSGLATRGFTPFNRSNVEVVRLRPPGLKGRSGNLELCGGLTLGEALGSPLPVRLKEVRTLESIPAWLAVRVALWRVLDEGSHSDLLCQSLACLSSWLRMARSPPSFQP